MESVLTQLRFIPGNLIDFPRGKTSLKYRVVNIIVLTFLLFEILKLSCCVLFDEKTQPWILYTGPYFVCLGIAGKMTYVAIISNTITAFICRFVIYSKRGNLDFLWDPLLFLKTQELCPTSECESSNNAEASKEDGYETKEGNVRNHIPRFKNECHNMIEGVKNQYRILFLTTNAFVLYTTVKNIMIFDNKFTLAFIYGFCSHVLLSFTMHYCNLITGMLWKIALNFLRMKMLILRDKWTNFISGDSVTEEGVEQLVEEIVSLKQQVSRFDECLTGLLVSSFVSFTPVFCTVIHSIAFGDFSSADLFLPIMLVLMLPVFIMERIGPMLMVAQLFSLSMSLYPLLNSMQVRSMGVVSLKNRIKLLRMIKSLGCHDKPIAPMTANEETFTPNSFFMYITSLFTKFLMLIEYVRQI